MELARSTGSAYDLLGKIKSIDVNPVDYKIHQNAEPESENHKAFG
jgi:hypothetical protein